MKFMKLGSRPDTFYTTETLRSVSSEVSSDLIVQIKGSRYLLHKFPLLSKCLRLQRLCSESSNSSQHQIIQLPDFPGGVEAFESCAKFCYGITITISSFNIVSIRCAAEYLQMTEEVEKGNLICKLDVFLNSCILRGWKDSMLALQSTKALPRWSEDLGITSRCIDAIASKILTNPRKVSLSHSYSRGGGGRRNDVSSYNGVESQHHRATNRGWWAGDIAEFGIDLYWRIMVAVKAGGRIPAYLIGEALKIYASRWLPNISKDGTGNKQAVADSCSDKIREITSKHRVLLESIVSLLPMEKGSATCSFLLKLLKAANILGASCSSKTELARRVGLQLEEATVCDLLIPSLSSTNMTVYDVDIVLQILEQFMQGQSPPTSPPRHKSSFEKRRRSRSAEHIDFEFQENRRSSSASHSSKLKVARLVDEYLQEIAWDVNLPLSKVVALAEAVPDFARPDHDDLYRAIDIYLKSHPDMNKSERKQLCRILDCKKLSMEACMHAAQNELLPLRVVVQVLFFEQTRAAIASGQINELTSNIKALLASHETLTQPPLEVKIGTGSAEDEWSVSGLKSPKSKLSTLKMKLAEEDNDIDDNSFMSHEVLARTTSSAKLKAFCFIPGKPKRMLSKLWPTNRSVNERH